MTDDLAQLYSIQPVCSALTTLFRQCCHRFSNQMCGIILNYAIVNVGNLCISSPLEVFKVTTYLGLVPGFTVSNSVFVLFAIIGACGVLTLFSLSLETIVPTAGQAMIEMMHSTVSELFRCTENGTNAFSNRVYVPLFLTFFLFISAINLSGMIPYSMTATSHVALTLGTSLALFMSVTITGLIKHQERFFDMFLPPNLPFEVRVMTSQSINPASHEADFRPNNHAFDWHLGFAFVGIVPKPRMKGHQSSLIQAQMYGSNG